MHSAMMLIMAPAKMLLIYIGCATARAPSLFRGCGATTPQSWSWDVRIMGPMRMARIGRRIPRRRGWRGVDRIVSQTKAQTVTVRKRAARKSRLEAKFLDHAHQIVTRHRRVSRRTTGPDNGDALARKNAGIIAAEFGRVQSE